NVPDLIFSADPSGRLIDVSPAAERITGYTVQELIGMQIRDIIHADDAASFDAMVTEVIQNPQCDLRPMRFRIRTKFGQEKHLEVNRHLTWDDEGKPVRIDGVARDISNQVRMEQELKAKAVQLENSTIELARANVDLLTAQEAVQKKHDEVRAILNASADPIVLVGTDRSISIVNNSLSRFLEMPTEAIIGMPFDSFVERAASQFTDEAAFRNRIHELARSQKSHSEIESNPIEMFASALNLRRSPERVVFIDSIVVRDDGGNEVGRVYYFGDVTAMRDAHRHMRTMIDASPIPWIMTRLDGHVLYANDHLAQLLGYSREELLDTAIPELLQDSGDQERLHAILERDGVVHGFETRIRRKDGSEVWCLCSLVVTSLGSQPVVIGGMYDITRRKNTEEELRFKEQRFRGLVENADEIIYSVTPDGKMTYLSPKFTELTGHTADDWRGSRFTDWVHPDDLERSRAWIASGFAAVDKAAEDPLRLRSKDGTWRWLTTSATPIRGASGEVVEVVGVAHDITEVKQALDDLKQAQTRLVQSEKMASLGLLVAGIAHEINTPVGAINSMHDTLMRAVVKLKTQLGQHCEDSHPIAADLKPIIDTIDSANRVISNGAERVMTIVRRLRSFARLDEAELKKADIHEGLEDTLTLIHHEIKNRITVRRDFGDVPEIACYPGRLNQVFLNLLNNARQAIVGEGTIQIRTFVRDSRVVVEIADSGKGIDAAHLKRIFDPGFTTKGVGVGTGLGLSICYQIIEDHRGTISVRSEVGKGTTFTIELPMDLDNNHAESRDR
ncbi:MAG: PAS domain S-box protein, partial [candidate division Zixibacteria bacterium]|nr:PAS domain S-box protein [candidate division Zixibacteria bacterium]